MIIIDTKGSDNKKIDGIKNIPLYRFKPLAHKIKNTNYTDFIFQSPQAVLNFSDHLHLLKKENINAYTMGHATNEALSSFGIDSINPNNPRSEELIKIIKDQMHNKKFLIIKGLNGLNIVSKFLKENDIYSEEIIVYERVELEDYTNLRNEYKSADAIIFPSVYAVEIFLKKIYTKKINAKLFCISNRILDQLCKKGLRGIVLSNYFSVGDLIKEIKRSI